MANLKSIGEKIRHIRILKNVTQAEMANKLGIINTSYSKIERNEVVPNYTRLEEIAKILDVTLVELITVSEKPKPVNQWEKIIAQKDLQIMQLQKKVIQLLEKKK
jgi:transcriptional regulator with XRE-family HTH domain